MNLIELPKLLDDMLKVTKAGPVTRWSDRLACLAESASIKMELINWYQSPRGVASEIIQYAKNNCSLEELKEAIENYEIESNS